jgi:hypothetical protein
MTYDNHSCAILQAARIDLNTRLMNEDAPWLAQIPAAMAERNLLAINIL